MEMGTANCDIPRARALTLVRHAPNATVPCLLTCYVPGHGGLPHELPAAVNAALFLDEAAALDPALRLAHVHRRICMAPAYLRPHRGPQGQVEYLSYDPANLAPARGP